MIDGLKKLWECWNIEEAVNFELSLILGKELVAASGGNPAFERVREYMEYIRDEKLQDLEILSKAVRQCSGAEARAMTDFILRSNKNKIIRGNLLTNGGLGRYGFLGARDYETPLGNRIYGDCLLYTSPSPRDSVVSRMPSSA